MNIESKNLFDMEGSIASDLIGSYKYPWEVLPHISEFIKEISSSLTLKGYVEIKPTVFVHESAKVFDSAYLGENIIIGPGTEIRQCAFLRGNVIAGEDCVIGNSSELKNVILFNHVEVPHYNYVGDSILGSYAHLGAGAVTSNIKGDRKNILIHNDGEEIETGLRKIGAILAEHVEVGCGSVLNPGTIVGKNTQIYPLSSVRGVVAAESIYKDKDSIVLKS